jgi:GNAT superfamily N-acetyltransferase
MRPEPFYTFQTHGGEQVLVRPAQHEDRTAMRELIQHSAAEHRLARVSSLTGTADDGQTELLADNAWVAVLAERAGSPPVALARFERINPAEAEITVIVRDDMRNRGIGSRLLYFLLDQMYAVGIRKAISAFASSNEAAWQILQYSPYHITWQPSEDQVDVVIHLQARASAASVN